MIWGLRGAAFTRFSVRSILSTSAARPSLAAHQGPQAAAEFQKILDHRGIVVSDPIGALARLQLGRAFALSGDKAKARSAYEDFLSLWKDAYLDIPILKQAKQEYARLQ